MRVVSLVVVGIILRVLFRLKTGCMNQDEVVEVVFWCGFPLHSVWFGVCGA